MDITVLSRSEAEQHSFHSGDWVISINERIGDMAKICGMQFLLPMCFDDVDAGKPGAMSEYHARSIVEFATAAKTNGGRLWVHCRAGISRSAGVAEALEAIGLASWTNKDEQTYIVGHGYQSKFHPNAHVSALIKRIAWEQPAPQPAQADAQEAK